MKAIDEIFAKEKLVPAIAQDYETGEVLMLAYMNKQSFEKMLEIGKACYWRRSTNRLWLKGEESGHFQAVKEIYVDCDPIDTILIKVLQKGGACHTGYRSCFYRRFNSEGEFEVVGEKVFDAEEVYGKR